MKCPACGYDGDSSEFGDFKQCPSCGAFYDKALQVRAKKNEILYQKAAVSERPQRKWSVLLMPLRETLYRYFSGILKLSFEKLFVVIGVVVVVSLIAFASTREQSSSGGSVRREDGGTREYLLTKVAVESVKRNLKDPDSAQFRGQFVGSSGLPCGEVNSKNSFGGYSGYQRFVVSGNNLVVFESYMSGEEFEKVWSRLCR
ncbi:hypothetical protein [Pseudomonas aeruginosa]|uniref:hypothetical protein n=1 Tax=Pseudomonas aeruginosa TaxID=287 RepID=UPI00249BCC71|nr:hypothetical protein [Pseudomonas aeruginosa]EIU3787370.1 hypothetical protein [Pseudomonas aeruginosa]EKV0487527.1 hypothetical protein [Pseudomonas aeruginosa]WGX88858.1 hypothetical protein QJ960_07050 [Pseudomonas aeruginosa]